MSKTTIKGQAVVDFVAEFTYSIKALGITTNVPSTSEGRATNDDPTNPSNIWSLRIDSSSKVDGNGVGVVLESPTGEKVSYALRLELPTSNNEAKIRGTNSQTSPS